MPTKMRVSKIARADAINLIVGLRHPDPGTRFAVVS